jgi:folate-binding protein YgfZ
MTEAVEIQTLKSSPLAAVHQRLGATLIEREGWSVPESFGDPPREYAAVREAGAGLLDLSPRGRILVSGTEAVQFLNGLITNDMKTLAENTWMPAAFPNVQGRLIASVRVMRLPDEKKGQTTPAQPPRRASQANASSVFLIDTEAATHERVLKTIERFTLAGDFRVSDLSQQTAMLSVQGRNAADIVRQVLGEAAAEIATNGAAEIAWQRGAASDIASSEITPTLTVIRATHTGEDGFDLIVDADQAADLWSALHDAGARPVGYNALEILRIEAGLPRFGVDMDETNVVTEAALDDAVSYTKGCYVGQEIIARIKYRGHVAKKLSGVAFERAVTVAAGAVIKSADEKEVGRLTSVTYSPQLKRTIALAYLKYDYLAPGNVLKVMVDNEEIEAQVAELPFVRRTLA